MLTALEDAIASGDPKAVEQAVFDLYELRLPWANFDDEIAFAVLDILKRPEIQPVEK